MKILFIILVLLLSCEVSKKELPKLKYKLRIDTKVDYMPGLKVYWVETFLFIGRYSDYEIIRSWSNTTEEKSKIRGILSKQKKKADKIYKWWSKKIKDNSGILDFIWKKRKSEKTIEITDY